MPQLHRLKVTLQGHVIYPSVWPTPYLLDPLNDFHKFHQDVPLSEAMCRTNDLATQTQCQGHTSRSWGLPLNLVSFESPQPFVRFSLNITQMFLSVSWCADPMTLSYANSKSRSHFKVMGFTLEFSVLRISQTIC